MREFALDRRDALGPASPLVRRCAQALDAGADSADEREQQRVRLPAECPSQRLGGDAFRREEDAPARGGRVAVVLAQPYDLAGGDHERIPSVQRPMPLTELEAASALFEVGEHEEVVRVSVIAGRVSSRELVSGGAGRRFVPGMGREWLLPLYDPFTRLIGVESAHRKLAEQAELASAGRVLEIGCGTGNLALLVKPMRPQLEVVGLDPDPKALARAARKAERAGLTLELDRGFADELPYPTGASTACCHR